MRTLEATIEDMRTLRNSLEYGESYETVSEAIKWLMVYAKVSGPDKKEKP